jgi:hypothetical protein
VLGVHEVVGSKPIFLTIWGYRIAVNMSGCWSPESRGSTPLIPAIQKMARGDVRPGMRKLFEGVA